MTTKEFIDIINNYTPFDIKDHRTDSNYLYELTDKLNADKDEVQAIEPIFRLIEKYPTNDFGSPGPLVHFIERFIGQYEQKLLESLDRKPTQLTVWMLNRVINGAKSKTMRLTLIQRLEGIIQNPNADNETRNEALDFLKFQKK
ncbi:MAG TPA: hypothetical protein PLZ32_08665 [Saprospiraceae bacterium]|nr:hypothetical protein [Saprospiraceae bacterium]